MAQTAIQQHCDGTDRHHTDRRTAHRTVLTNGTDVTRRAGSLSSCPGGIGGGALTRGQGLPRAIADRGGQLNTHLTDGRRDGVGPKNSEWLCKAQ